MRNVKVAVAFTLLALAGCTSTTDNAPFGSSSTSSTSPTASSSAPTTLSSPGQATGGTRPTAPPSPPTSAAPLEGGSTEVPTAQVDAATLPDNYDQRVATSADGRTVQVVGMAGGCKSAGAEVTAQSGDQVLITLVTTYYPPAEGAVCTQELREVPLNVTLDAPLGSRRIVLEAREDTA